MVHTVKRFLSSRWFGASAFTAVALSFFWAGLVVASDLHWTGVSEAQSPAAAPQAQMLSSAQPESFAELVKQLSPAVVSIKVTKVAKVRGWSGTESPEDPFGELFRRFFKDSPQFREQFRRQGAGSGVIISEEGYILTNNHVVEGAEQITVTLANSQEYTAEVVGRDRKTDLAVLKVEPTESLPVATMGISDALQVGDWVLAIGNPFGLGHTVTSGIVSAKGRVIGAGPYDDFIQTDASINPGNSGGPLFNMQGEVVGINTAILPHGRGIGFAIPIDTARPLIPQLITTGSVTRGYLGVGIQSVTPALATALKLQESAGVLVADVVPGSPAEHAGIRRGDVIVMYKNEPVEDARDLPTMVAATPVGEEVEVVVLRDGKKHELPLTVGKLPSEEHQAEESGQPSQGKWGLRLRDITPEMAQQHGLKIKEGALVVGVEPESPAEKAGIQQGDILVEMNHQPVTSVQDVKGVLAKVDDQDTLLLLVQRHRRSLYVALAK
jgi:serine protease Do